MRRQWTSLQYAGSLVPLTPVKGANGRSSLTGSKAPCSPSRESRVTVSLWSSPQGGANCASAECLLSPLASFRFPCLHCPLPPAPPPTSSVNLVEKAAAGSPSSPLAPLCSLLPSSLLPGSFLLPLSSSRQYLLSYLLTSHTCLPRLRVGA